MADPILTTQVQPPNYDEKKYIELNDPGMFDYFGNQVPDNRRGMTLSQIAQTGSLFGVGGDAVNIAKGLSNRGLGDLQVGDVLAGKNSPEFIQKYGLGKAYSLSDYVKKFASSDPNFDPSNQQSVNDIAAQISSRGLDPQKDQEAIQGFIANSSVKSAIDKTQNPGKYQTADQNQANLDTATRLIQQTFGTDKPVDPDMASFLAGHLASGETPFEVAQFLKTTPDYLQQQSDAQSQKYNAESQAARDALNQNLLQTQQEVFKQAQPGIIASYMKAGRLNSSGLNSALAQAQAQLDQQRQGFLGQQAYQSAVQGQGYNREDFVNQQGQAFNQYLRQNQPAYQNQLNAAGAQSNLAFQQPYNQLARQYSLNDAATARQQQLQDYATQQSDFNRYLSQNRSQQNQSALYGLGGSAISALIGGLTRRSPTPSTPYSGGNIY